MHSIPIILGSTRRGRLSERVALFVTEKLGELERVNTELLDLLEYDFRSWKSGFTCGTIRLQD